MPQFRLPPSALEGERGAFCSGDFLEAQPGLTSDSKGRRGPGAWLGNHDLRPSHGSQSSGHGHRSVSRVRIEAEP